MDADVGLVPPADAAAVGDEWYGVPRELGLGDLGVIRVESLWGHCPVEGEGTLNGERFWFRARGQRWTFAAGGAVHSKPRWRYEEAFGETFEAGWMTRAEAEGFIRKAAEMVLRGHPGSGDL